MSGWTIPLARIDAASSSRFCVRKRRRGWTGLGSIELTGSVVVGLAASGAVGCETGAGREGSSAESPLPSALRGLSVALLIRENLLGEADVAFCPFRSRIVHQDGLAETRRLRQPNATRNDRLEDFVLKELLQVVSDLTRQVGALVIH